MLGRLAVAAVGYVRVPSSLGSAKPSDGLEPSKSRVNLLSRSRIRKRSNDSELGALKDPGKVGASNEPRVDNYGLGRDLGHETPFAL